jgi:asparagine synthase (glutamine-hydrolysing)
MCGIAGLWNFDGQAQEELRVRAEAMADDLRHRGPDDAGVWTDAAAGIALSFRRLSILDLTAAGAQPMQSATGRYVIVFNGEIYNFQRLRAELSPQSYRGHSDTEVLLAAIETWGIEGAAQRCIGMFAFAVWDKAERVLTLVRDRMGVKPLFYSATAAGVAFASELRAMPHRDRIDRGAVALYARFGYVPSPWSIYEGICKLPPGHLLRLTADGRRQMDCYWDAKAVIEHAVAHPFAGGESEAVETLDRLLADAVRLRLIADVPVGLFLSGGIDSGLIASLMHREASAVSTFTLGFEDEHSDADLARAIAGHLGTRHHELIVRATDAIDLIPTLAAIADEPMGDSSLLPTYLVSRLARQSVTVALSGDGGDELFGGYHRYFLGQRLTSRVARVPRRLRRPAAAVLRNMPMRAGNRRDSARGLAQALVVDDPIAQFLAEVDFPGLPVADAPAHRIAATHAAGWPDVAPIDLMMYLDAVGFLPDDILAKVDRASMAVSLEVREPLLDHRIVELAWSLPSSMKIGDRRGKLILRRLLAQYLPESLIDQGKRGFGLPLQAWLRGPLRSWTESLLAPRRIAAEGFFEPEAVARLWDSPGGAGIDALWRLLMFQAWMAKAS